MVKVADQIESTGEVEDEEISSKIEDKVEKTNREEMDPEREKLK